MTSLQIHMEYVRLNESSLARISLMPIELNYSSMLHCVIEVELATYGSNSSTAHNATCVVLMGHSDPGSPANRELFHA